MLNKDELMWVEKYRPKKLNEIVGLKHIVESIQAFLKNPKTMPHLLLSGIPGTGKTTVALCIARELFGENWKTFTLELNASDERGINTVRDRIKGFSRYSRASFGNVPFALIVLDESDQMTKPAQTALRRIMETSSRTSRFILICNYSNKIIEPIQSRCAIFRFSKLNKKAMVDHIKNIAEKEELVISAEIAEKIIEYSNADIFCINESHLTPKTSLEGEVFGYQWIGHNRPHSHVNAKRCHGGVGMFVKKCIMHNFYTNIVDKEYDGILAVKFVNKITEYTFIVISCYLPPEYSKWGRDSTSFFNHLVMLLYSYESDMTIMAGDVNSRIGNLEDCMDKENIPVREILDETKNQHGIAFVEFLKETSCCVLNGRIDSSRNDFTSVTSKGKSVVDYIMVPVTDFKCCKRFSVESCTEISSKSGLQEHINIRSKLPDHSLLSMYFSFESNIKLERKESVLDSKNSYKYNCIPNDFLLDEEGRKYLESMIVNITLCKENQENVDSLYMYGALLTGLVKEFDRRIPIRPKRGINKQVKVRHPFWNSELENKWQVICRAEKL